MKINDKKAIMLRGRSLAVIECTGADKTAKYR